MEEILEEHYEGPERRQVKHTYISEELVESIAERAAEKAVQKITEGFYQSVGRSIISKMMYILGIVTIGGYFYLQQKGLLK